jgi:hypothetical protein
MILMIDHVILVPDFQTKPKMRSVNSKTHPPTLWKCSWWGSQFLTLLGNACYMYKYTIWLFNIAMENHHFW